jgi:hypothetical protein
LGETHRQVLIQARETSQSRIAFITGYAFLKLEPGKLLHELSENSLANVHYSLSERTDRFETY